jgi:hypothetical protein
MTRTMATSPLMAARCSTLEPAAHSEGAVWERAPSVLQSSEAPARMSTRATAALPL